MDSRDDLARLIFNHWQDETASAEARVLADAILKAGWVPGELLAAEQARNATLADTIQRVEATHTRAYTAGHGGTRIAYCEQDSEAAQEWVSWPCPTVCALSEKDG